LHGVVIIGGPISDSAEKFGSDEACLGDIPRPGIGAGWGKDYGGCGWELGHGI